MSISPFRTLLQWVLVVAVVLAQPVALFAQEPRVHPLSQNSNTKIVEPTLLASLTYAPGMPEMNAPETVAPSESLQPVSPASMAPMMVVATKVLPAELAQHHFMDRENRALFVAVGGMAAADFCVTRANLASGGRELNPVTRVLSGSTPGLAANFALETSGVIGVSYLFHRTGHHKLERVISFVSIGESAGAVGYGLAHR